MARHKDALFHPAFIDPRFHAALNPYDETPPPAVKPVEAPRRETRSRDFDIKHIRIELRIDPSETFIEGEAAISLAPFRDGLQELSFDAFELNVKDVRNGSRRLEFESHRDKLLVHLKEALPRDKNLTLRVLYNARPRKGLHFIRPDDAYPEKPLQVWSQGESEDNSAWFPCTDAPNERQTTETIITVPEAFTVLSNGRLVSEKHDKRRGSRTFHWRQDEPHPAYLVSIAVGDFSIIEARCGRLPTPYYTYHGTEKEARMLMGRTPAMIRHFTKLFGYEYPYPKYSQVVVDDFISGAMENTSATTHSDRFMHDARTELDFDCHDVVAHELAHQWWGDLLTPKSWTHLWLKESFATYAEILWSEHAEGSDESRFFLLREQNVYMAEDRDRYRRPIVYDRWEYPMEVYDRHAYQKGGLVLGMLRYVLGNDAFFRTLKYYAHKHEWQSVETADFRIAIEEVTGRNLDWFFEEWITGKGYPEFEVSHRFDSESGGLRLTVKQVQDISDGTPVFRMPVEIEVLGKRGKQSFRVEIEKPEHEFYFSMAERPLAVVFDPEDRVLKTLEHRKARQELLHQLRQAESFTARMRSARSLAEFRDDETVAALRRALMQDSFGPVRMAAAVALAEIGTTEARDHLVAAMKKSEEARVRRAIAWSLGRFRKDRKAIAALVRAMDEDESYFVGAFSMRALAHAAGEDAYEKLIGMLGRDSYQDVLRATVFDALAIAKDKRGIRLALDHTAYGIQQSVRIAATVALGTLGKEFKDEHEVVYQKLIELLEDKTFRVRLAAVKALAVLGDPRAIAPLQSVVEREAIDAIQSAALGSRRALEEKVEEGKQDGKKEK
ncbi:MAG: HEAT repeat domain-containing protein [Pyrinomonadaceae bacterium]|nr:HEAT repeat domain-containing protein [Pyrinomonadaceae bacterium]